VSGGPFVQHRRADTLTIVDDAHLKVTVVIADFDFNVTRVRMTERIAQRFAGDPVGFVADDWMQMPRRAFDGDIDDAPTVTVSATEPTESSKSSSIASWTLIVTSGLTTFLKPGFSISRRYRLGGRFARRYSPAALIEVARRTFVSVATAATFASAITALEESATWPVRDPLGDWARSAELSDKKMTASASTQRIVMVDLLHRLRSPHRYNPPYG
jgi:hypothetical protein